MNEPIIEIIREIIKMHCHVLEERAYNCEFIENLILVIAMDRSSYYHNKNQYIPFFNKEIEIYFEKSNVIRAVEFDTGHSQSLPPPYLTFNLLHEEGLNKFINYLDKFKHREITLIRQQDGDTNEH